ncbi:MAG: hypothetical protein J6Y09_06650 [Lachnospiraceae bacterium]|nr:hypothetical protein [Lachnospiraceae bacterium]
MKIYGYTYMAIEGMGDGTYTETEIFINRDERNRKACDRYIHDRFWLKKYGFLTSECVQRPKEEIIKEFDKVGGYLRLDTGETFAQIEAFERDL